MDPTRSITTTDHHTSSTSVWREEYCWSEDATEALIEAWGDRYILLNRGKLSKKDWKEVADTVNSRLNDGVKSMKTDVQCINRMDTLKKKYKIEKSKQPSKWPFYQRLDSLIGTNSSPPSKSRKNNNAVSFSIKLRTKTVKRITELFDLESEDEREELGFCNERVEKKELRMEDVHYSDGAACRELARAILRFGEIYERIESNKQKQMFELEKERIKVIKEIELEKLNMFINAQIAFERKSASFCSGRNCS